MRRKTIPAAGVVAFMAMLVCPGSTSAAVALFAASPYNVFVLNSFTDSYDDAQGGLAAGGNITLTGFSIGQGLTSAQAASQFPLGDSLVAGGLLTASSGELYAGNAYGATTNVSSSFTLNAGSLISGGSPVIDFSNAAAQLEGLSSSLAGMATTAGDSCTVAYGTTTTCTATGNYLNIVDITDPTEFAGKTIDINSTGNNATLVINVAGASDSLGGAGFNVFNNGTSVLFNYYQANTLQLGSSAFTSSVLAPLAAVSPAGGGSFSGTLVAGSFNGQMEFHNSDPFSGALAAAAPEPTSIVLAGAGLIAICFFLRKRPLSWKADGVAHAAEARHEQPAGRRCNALLLDVTNE